jgi:hypothetical protein
VESVRDDSIEEKIRPMMEQSASNIRSRVSVKRSSADLGLPFSFALDVSLASSLRPDPSDTNEARQ